MRKEIIISGFGGQGVMLAGTLVCFAGMKGGKEVTFFPSYGAEMRGGTANCKVIISDTPIGSPVFEKTDILIALNRPSFERFSPKVKEGGVVFVNSSLFSPTVKQFAFDLVEISANNIAEECGTLLAANMVMLGALAKKTSILQLEYFLNSISDALPGKEKLWKANEKALNSGFNAVEV